MVEMFTPILLDDFVVLYVLCGLLSEINALGGSLFRNKVEKNKSLMGSLSFPGKKILLKCNFEGIVFYAWTF